VIAREYTKKIEFFRSQLTPDGFGGNITLFSFLTAAWAKIEHKPNTSRLVDLGVTDPKNTIILYVRKRSDVTYNINDYITYNGKDYTIQSITEIKDVDFEIIATNNEN